MKHAGKKKNPQKIQLREVSLKDLNYSQQEKNKNLTPFTSEDTAKCSFLHQPSGHCPPGKWPPSRNFLSLAQYSLHSMSIFLQTPSLRLNADTRTYNLLHVQFVQPEKPNKL